MPRPRKKDSCNTCRQRKVKCDGETPVCLQCTKAGRYCDRSETVLDVYPWAPSKKPENRALGEQQDPTTPQDPRLVLQCQKQARLFENYLAEVSKWYDLSDATCRFETEVPQISLNEPLLFNAIMALSAIHLHRTSIKGARDIAERYHACCVQLLINLDDGDAMIANGVALAATCLLRSYEILDGDIDPNRHLWGAYSMASRQGLLAGNMQSSLLAAGFWNYLREDITFSLFESCPLKMDLEHFSLSIRQRADADYLNSISLILGKTINAAFKPFMTATEGNFAISMLHDWSTAVPERTRPYSVGNGLPGVIQSLPSVWTLQPCHAAMMQYFLVALTILAIHGLEEQIENLRNLDPFKDESEFSSRDNLLNKWALYICGLAFTTKRSPVIVNAFGPMAFCAKYIQAQATREELKRQLLACKPVIGWPVERLIGDLESYWNRGTASRDAGAMP